MKMEFEQIRDPLFVLATVLYCSNKFILLQLGQLTGTFLESYLNDILLVPVLLPILTWIAGKAGWRNLGARPSHWEILATLVPVIIVCEYIGPFYLRKGVADPLDILAYVAGGLISWSYWKYRCPVFMNQEPPTGRTYQASSHV